MNHNTQRNQLEMQLKKYMDFIPFCPNDGVEKLVNEMMKIHSRIETIKNIPGDAVFNKVECHFETKQSKINFSNKL